MVAEPRLVSNSSKALAINPANPGRENLEESPPTN